MSQQSSNCSRSDSLCSVFDSFEIIMMGALRATILPDDGWVRMVVTLWHQAQLMAPALTCTLLSIWCHLEGLRFFQPSTFTLCWRCNRSRSRVTAWNGTRVVLSAAPLPLFSLPSSLRVLPAFARLFTKGVSAPAQSCSGSHARICRNLSKGCDNVYLGITKNLKVLLEPNISCIACPLFALCDEAVMQTVLCRVSLGESPPVLVLRSTTWSSLGCLMVERRPHI